MFNQFLLTINMWMTDTFALAVLGCFLWGMVSVLFSPCHLASIPLMVGYVAGQGHEIQGREAAGYAGVFSLGLFLSIAVVGVIADRVLYAAFEAVGRRTRVLSGSRTPGNPIPRPGSRSSFRSRGSSPG